MIRSMTAFARSDANGPWGELAWELRSVNHRYLDLSLRLPDELRALEPQVREHAGAQLGRGKVDCVLRLKLIGERTGLDIDPDQLKALAQGCEQVAQALPTSQPDPLRVLQWPGVLREAAPDTDALGAAALVALDEALTGLSQSREQEGARMENMLRERVATVAELTQQVRERLPQVRAHWREKLATRLADLEHAGDPGRIEQEIVIFAQRLDVDEELTRLDSHIKEFEQALKRNEPVGRRLDFLMQEFNREANTLASKSQDPDVTRIGVDMKVAIEQMREQVQNIE